MRHRMRRSHVVETTPRGRTEPLAVDVQEASRLTSLSIHTIRLYIRKGKLNASRVGRRIIVPMEALQELVKRGATGN